MVGSFVLPAGRRVPVELLAAPALALALGLALLLDQTWLAIVFGMVQLAVVPGYLMLWALFPTRGASPDGGLSPLERTALAVPVSFALVALVGLVVNALLGHLTGTGIAVGLALVDGLALAVALVRHVALPVDRRWSLASLAWPPGPGPWAVTACAVLASVALLWFASAPPQHDEPFTSLALAGPSGAASCYPAVYEDGAYVAATRINGTLVPLPACPRMDNVTAIVVNLEQRAVEATLRVSWAEPTSGRDVVRSVLLTASRSLEEGERWAVPVPLGVPPGTGPVFLYVQVFLGDPPAGLSGPLPAAHEEVRLAIERGAA